jgi:hypothetical protein
MRFGIKKAGDASQLDLKKAGVISRLPYFL